MPDAPSPAIDPNVIASLRALTEAGEPDVVHEVLGLFLVDAPTRIQALSAAVDARDAAALQRAAHTLKGASGTIGAIALQAACRELEQMAKRNTLDEAEVTVAVVHREFRRAKDEIEQLL